MSLQELDHDYAVHDARQEESDKSLAVRFHLMPMKNEEASVEAGRPIYKDVEFIDIRVRGDRNNLVSRPVRDDDRARFRSVYQNFVNGNREVVTGTPLSQWPMMSASQVEELKYFGFSTVEELAKAGDNVVAKMMGLQGLKNKAIAYLELAAGGAPLEKMQAQLTDLANKLETAERTAAEQAKTIAELSKTAKK